MTAPKKARRDEPRGEQSVAGGREVARRLRIDFKAGDTLRLVGVPLGLVLERVLDGETTPFDPAPEPTLRELIDFHATTENVSPDDVQLAELSPPAPEVWADYLGMQADYEAPESGGWPEEGRLQTLIFPQGLKARLDAFLQNFERAQTESDGEELYLAFGALEKAEGESLETVPLALLGVRLIRSSQGPLLETLGGACFLNPELPSLLDEQQAAQLTAPKDAESLAALLKSLEASAGDWKPRRYLTLFAAPLLGFWTARDLERAAWTGQEDSPVAKCLSAGSRGEFVSEEKQASPEEIDQSLEPLLPLDDAQSRVLLAALDGENLLVEGGPKSGKTQTAAGLVLEAVARGKRVLYLSARKQSIEELEARTKAAGLGREVLTLEGQATAETELPGRLAARLAGGGETAAPEGLEELRREQAERRDALSSYRKAALATLGKLELSAAQILFEAGRLKLASPNLVAFIPKAPDFDPLKVDEAQRRAAKEKLLAVEAMVARVSANQPLAQHPWAGVSSLALGKAARREAAVAALAQAKEAFAEVVKEADLLVRGVDGKLEQDEQLLLDVKSLAREGENLENARPRVANAFDLTRRVLDKLYLKTSNEAAAVIAIEKMIALAEAAPEALGLVPRALITDHYLDEQLAEIEPKLSRLVEAKNLIAATFDLEGVRALGAERLREIAGHLRRRKLFKFSDKERRLAKKQLRKIRILKDRSSTAVMPELLEETARYLDNEAAFFAEPGNSDLLGEDMESAEYWMAALQAGRGWVHDVEAAFDEGFGRRTQIAPALVTLEFAELAELVEVKQDPAFGDLQWLRGVLLASGQDWDYAKGPIWKAFLSTLVSPAAAEVLAPLKPSECKAFVKRCGDVAGRIAAFEEAWKTFQTKTELRASLWDPRSKPNLKERLKRIDHALSDTDSLAEWIELMALLNEDKRPGVTEIMKTVVVGSLPKAGACDLYDLLLFEGLAEAALAAHPALAQFAPEEQEKLRLAFAEGELRLAELRSQEVSANRAKAVAEAKDALKTLESRLTQAESLEAGDLLSDELEAILTLSPCLATTPALAARWLPAKQGLFDLVVLDDATLLSEEDLQPMARRAKSLVAFADPMRMAPPAAGSASQRLAEVVRRTNLETYYGDLDPVFAAVPSGPRPADSSRVLPFPSGSQEPRATVSFQGSCDADQLAKAVLKQLSAAGGASFGVLAIGDELRVALEERLDVLLEDRADLRACLAGPEGREEGFFLRSLSDYRGEERDLLFLLLGEDIEPLADLPAAAVSGLPLRVRRELRVYNGVEADLLAEGPDESAAVYLSRLLAATKEQPRRAAGEPSDPLLRALGGKNLSVCEAPVAGALLVGGALWVAHDRDPATSQSSLRESLVHLPARLEGLGWSYCGLSSSDWRRDPEGECERVRKAARQAASRLAPLQEKQA